MLSPTRPRLRGAFVIAALVASSAIAFSTSAHEVAAAPVGESEIVGVASGRCLDVAEAKTAPRSILHIFDCKGSANQQWTLTDAGELRVYDTTTCLDVRGRDTTAPAVAQIYPCNGGDNQKWELNDDGSIVGVQSGLCLDVVRRRTANSSVVGMWTCNGQTNQQWTTSFAPDTDAPTAPGNARVGEVACDAVTLSWDASSDDVGVDSYDIYRDGQFIRSVDADTLSSVIELDPGTTWGLYINARDAAGNVSPASTTVQVSPPQCEDDTEAPTAPSDLSASASGTSVTLNWGASTDDIGVRSYVVSRNGIEIGTVGADSGVEPSTTFTDSGLAPDTTYTYSVTARDAQDNTSEPSAPVEVTTGANCDSAICDIEEVTTDTDIPWGLVTLPDGTVLYNRRDAHDIIHLDPETGDKTTIGDIDAEGTEGEGGLTGLEISDDFENDRWLYIMYTTKVDNRIVRIQFDGEELLTDTEEVLLTGIQRARFHDGGRLRFGPDGKLYAATGDAENDDLAQQLDSLNGKILRLNPDGSVPSDNPYGNYVWSYGHRNPQGLAFDSQGRLWQQEFGNTIMDETNLIEKGGNYGWPACEGTSGDCDDPEFIAPKRTYINDNASCSGIAIVDDAVYIACLGGRRMLRLEIEGDSLTNLESYYEGTYGRLRTVEPTGDGGLWLTTSSGDKDSEANNSSTRIFRITLGNPSG